MYYTYMLRCDDNSIYTGITTDINRRMSEHFNKEKPAAKYTKIRTPIKLEASWSSENRVDATKLEYRIKKLTKPQKELLIKDPSVFEKFLDEKLICSNYKRL